MLIHCKKVPNKKNCPEGKKSDDFAFALFDSVEKINKEHWNSIVPYGSEFLQLPFLSVLEKEHPDNMRFHYAILYQENKPAAIAYFQVIDFSTDSIGSMIPLEDPEFSCLITGYLKKHLTKHLLRSVDKINMRLLICGNAFVSGEHGFAYSPKVNRTEAFDALADVIYRISSSEKLRGKIAAVLVKDFYKNTRKASDELSEFKYHDFLVEPNMIVDIEWGSFEEYLNAMSKKYRNRAKTIIKKGAELERRMLTAKEITSNSKKILQLYNNVHFKAKFRMATLSPTYFATMKKELGDKFNFVAYYLDGKLVGFRSEFLLEKEIEAHFIGLDYDINKDLELYQNMLYDFVREAIKTGSSRVVLGRTASEIKSTVGAEAYELTCYIRHRNPLSNRIIKPFIDYLKPTEWVPRNPFKEVSV